jgi:anti-sigma B factor antagonist
VETDERTHVEEAFDSTVEYGSEATVVSVSGEVDVATAPTLRQRLDEALDRGPGLLVVDLTGVSFIDSTALGVLIGAHERCTAAGTTLRLVVAEPRILKIFEITGLTELFDIRADRHDAVTR